MATEKPSFFEILSESRKITTTHSRHFLALSVLFILPLSFLIVAFPTLQHSISHSNATQLQSLQRFHPHNSIHPTPLILSFLCAFTLLTLALCAIATVSYSVHRGFFGRPVKFIHAIRSLSNSLARLFVTQFIILCGFLVIGLAVFGAINRIVSLGFMVKYNSGIYAVGFFGLGFGFACVYVNWVLAPVIVVVEASWGLEPLRRSADLVKGMRRVVICLLIYFGFMSWLPVFTFGNWTSTDYGDSFWGSANFVMQIVAGSAMLTTFLLHGLAANTVLYMNCKALHGELAGEIAEEFAEEYVTLPYDAEKVPHLVSVVQP